MSTARNLIRKNLRRLRKERGLAASAIARLLGVETNHMYRIERGDTALSPEHLDKICIEYNVDHDYFLTDHDNPSKKQQGYPDDIPPEIYNELLRVKKLSPEARKSVINFIRFQINEMESQKNEAE